MNFTPTQPRIAKGHRDCAKVFASEDKTIGVKVIPPRTDPGGVIWLYEGGSGKWGFRMQIQLLPKGGIFPTCHSSTANPAVSRTVVGLLPRLLGNVATKERSLYCAGNVY